MFPNGRKMFIISCGDSCNDLRLNNWDSFEKILLLLLIYIGNFGFRFGLFYTSSLRSSFSNFFRVCMSNRTASSSPGAFLGIDAMLSRVNGCRCSG